MNRSYPSLTKYPLVQGLWTDFGAILKFVKNPILIRISSNFLCNTRKCICIRKNYKMENSLLVIFDEI